MDKSQIIKEKLNLIDWCESLKGLSNDIWFARFKGGSWGIADVISHFISWDRFLLENRIPFIIHSEKFPVIKIDVNAINAEASRYARSGISKADLINDFVLIRKNLVSQTASIPDDRFQEPLNIGSSVTLAGYFSGLIEHDKKHMDQINAFIKSY
ncbi:DinB family protein [Neobacillus mesonae]|uniref:DinB family protein n=1 Tax=Neobacillus mesonae TaxID=1193713 RepID=UPI0025740C3B|nr:DinB family protein [Neobacillus mesonae]